MQSSIQERLTKQPTVEPVIQLKVTQSDFISAWPAAEVVKNLDMKKQSGRKQCRGASKAGQVV
jgi:hypothetical protein